MPECNFQGQPKRKKLKPIGVKTRGGRKRMRNGMGNLKAGGKEGWGGGFYKVGLWGLGLEGERTFWECARARHGISKSDGDMSAITLITTLHPPFYAS